MSGGVDSSVAATLLVEQGYEVTGVMLRLWADAGCEGEAENRCCTPEAVDRACHVASLLGIPFRILDVETLFKRHVVDEFITAYTSGITPNPCLACNRYVRFGWLLDYVLTSGARYLATGHYVRVYRDDKGQYHLLRGVDHSKDQSYVLYMLGQRELAHTLFPVGDYPKAVVRRMAAERGLPVASQPESQDLCFVANGDYRRFLQKHAPSAVRPGPIVDRTGRILDQHQGLAFYTIGQRKGLRIAAREPLYVLALDPRRNAVVVGTRDELGRDSLEAKDVSWISGEPPAAPLQALVKIRYRAREVPARVEPLPDRRARVQFQHPLRDITAGQGVVFYQGEECLGGGIIV